MTINWIKKSEEIGSANLSNNCIVINKSFFDRFKECYSALVGLDESKNLVIKPLSLDESESKKYTDSLLLKISVFQSFVRLGNTASMKTIGDLLGLKLEKNPVKFETNWSNEENALIIRTGKEK